uniref:Coat protein n=1 Tax=Johnsongrass chlorotic stripe mosaic virus TaxID=229149 RepID=A0A8E8FUD0_9TOMB|nr:coat protein [Johnsongrass chlorotic stripe mosaic virus]
MSIVPANTNRALVRAGTALASGAMTAMVPYAAAGAHQIGQRLGKKVWNGVGWVSRGAWNRLRKRMTNGGGVPMIVGGGGGTVAAPVAVSRQIRSRKPKFTSVKGQVRVTHREYVTQVSGVGSGLFQLNGGLPSGQFRVNPNNAACFPWLLSIASNFDQYRFVNLQLCYVPLCATTEVGRVALFYDKDSGDSGPFERAELANMTHCAETPPWAEVSLTVPCDNVKRYLNDSNVTDLKLVDAGRFGYAVYGGNANTYGDLFIQYTVELSEPQPTAGLIGEVTGNAGTVAGVVQPAYFNFDGFSTTQVAFKPTVVGTYLMTFILDGTGLVLGNVTSSAPEGMSVLDQNVAGSATRVIYVCRVTVQRPGDRLFFNYTGTATFWNLFVVRATRDISITT